MSLRNAAVAFLACFVAVAVSSTSSAICYDPTSPGHQCPVPKPGPPSSTPTVTPEPPLVAVEVLVAVGSAAGDELTKILHTDIPTPGVETLDNGTVTGIWSSPTSGAAQRASRLAALRAITPLQPTELVGFAFSANGISYLATAEARRLELFGASVLGVSASFDAAQPQVRSAISVRADGLPCPINATIDVGEEAAVSGGAVHASTVTHSTSYDPGDIACDTLLDPGLIATITAVTAAILASKPTPVLGPLVSKLPACVPVGQLPFFLSYDRAGVSGSYFYAAAVTVDPPTSCKTGWCGCTCIDRTTDKNNCGACGNQCAPGQVCTAGACACPAGDALCDGACVDLEANAANCGDCGHRCESGQVCRTGKCTRPSAECNPGTSLCTCRGNSWCTTPAVCQRVCGNAR